MAWLVNDDIRQGFGAMWRHNLLLSFASGPVTESFEFGSAFHTYLLKMMARSYLYSPAYVPALLTWAMALLHTVSPQLFNRNFLPRHWQKNKPHENGTSPKTLNISPPHPGYLQAFFAVKTIFVQTNDCAGVFQSKHVARYIEKHSENNFLKQINSWALELYAHSNLCHH